MKVFAYLRKSPGDSDPQNSIEYQFDAVASRFNKEYSDIDFRSEVESAVLNDRPVWRALVDETKKLLKKKEEVTWITLAVDRMMRNLEDLPVIQRLLDDGLSIKSCFDGDITQNNVLEFVIKGAFAAHEPRQTKKRQRAAYAKMIADGKWPFSMAKGYMADLNNKCIRIPNPDTYLGVRRLFKEFLKHDGGVNSFLPKAKKILKAYGERTANFSTLIKILTNKYYIGILEWNGIKSKGKHKTFIDESLFYQVQDKIEGTKWKKKTKHSFLFQLHVRCKCKHYLIGEIQKGRVYYRCHEKKCEVTSFREDRLIKTVSKVFQEMKITKRGARKQIERLKAEKDERVKRLKAENAKLVAKKNEIEERISNLFDLWCDKKISESKYREQNKKYESELLNAESLLRRDNFSKIIDCAQEILELLENGLLSWNSGDQEKMWLTLRFFTLELFVIDSSTVQICLFPHLSAKNKVKMKDGGAQHKVLELELLKRWELNQSKILTLKRRRDTLDSTD